jgi:hypothetical protein
VAEWLLGHPQAGVVDPWEDARQILEAVLPLIERDVQRKMARHLVALDETEPDLYGSYAVLRTSLRKAARGKPLPARPPKVGRDIPATPGGECAS